ncbi:TetR/AcrR family transcriptional regulator [Marivirga sp. S37H4]|uniref:TetR/AcrR family transcriptional regulator n=1 Tax=Marivirga aurantiaca TaxID=2802615 RepID=A0A934X0K3_9BACT|nr:TetR/AcrR family transcriptional regulator [Marivirga aurantiaca]MBK6266684.1 TetR/AcrR family transcriptional regulator [Marivirga aurantiaca]
MNVHSAIKNKIDKKSLILNTTLVCISEFGFHGTPISMIAEKAGIGAGTIYRYFENKEALINELFLEIKRDVMAQMLKDYDSSLDFKSRFKHLWMNLISYFMKHPQEFQFIEQHRYASYMSMLTREESFMIMSPVMMFFIEAKREKAIKDLPLYTIISLAYGPITSLAKLQIDHQQNLSAERIDQAANACWDAVRLIERS